SAECSSPTELRSSTSIEMTRLVVHPRQAAASGFRALRLQNMDCSGGTTYIWSVDLLLENALEFARSRHRHRPDAFRKKAAADRARDHSFRQDLGSRMPSHGHPRRSVALNIALSREVLSLDSGAAKVLQPP